MLSTAVRSGLSVAIMLRRFGGGIVARAASRSFGPCPRNPLKIRALLYAMVDCDPAHPYNIERSAHESSEHRVGGPDPGVARQPQGSGRAGAIGILVWYRRWLRI